MIETLSEKELPVNLFINQNQMGHLTEGKSFVVFVRWNLKSIEAQQVSKYHPRAITPSFVQIEWEFARLTGLPKQITIFPSTPLRPA